MHGVAQVKILIMVPARQEDVLQVVKLSHLSFPGEIRTTCLASRH